MMSSEELSIKKIAHSVRNYFLDFKTVYQLIFLFITDSFFYLYKCITEVRLCNKFLC